MSPLAVFVRTLLKSSAICFGIAIAVVQPTVRPGKNMAIAQNSPTQAATDGLIAALKDPDAGVRGHAAAALGQLRSREAVPALITAAGDSEVDVRRRALKALAEIRDRRAMEVAAAALKDPDAGVRRAAVYVLAELGGGDASR